MESQVLLSVLEIYSCQGIPICIVGELALNYYNVPRVINDLEFCVRANDLPKAAQLLSKLPSFEKAPTKDFNMYTEYQRDSPRFQYRPCPRIHVSLFSDALLHLDPLEHNIIPSAAHEPSAAQYSKEFEGVAPIEDMLLLPLPRLRAFFAGACRRYEEHGDAISGMAVEQLIDGMDLDERWCRGAIPGDRPHGLKFALERLRGKKNRTMDSFLNNYTCFIADETEARVVHAIPGRDDSGQCSVSATSDGSCKDII